LPRGDEAHVAHGDAGTYSIAGPLTIPKVIGFTLTPVYACILYQLPEAYLPP